MHFVYLFDRYLIFYLILLAAEVILATVLKYTLGYDRPNCGDDAKWYLGTEDEVCETQLAQVSQQLEVQFVVSLDQKKKSLLRIIPVLYGKSEKYHYL